MNLKKILILISLNLLNFSNLIFSSSNTKISSYSNRKKLYNQFFNAILNRKIVIENIVEKNKDYFDENYVNIIPDLFKKAVNYSRESPENDPLGLERIYQALNIFLTKVDLKKINLNRTNYDGETLLTQTTNERELDKTLVELLLKYGADPNIADKQETNMLPLEHVLDRPEIIKLLLDYNANPYKRSSSDLPILIDCVINKKNLALETILNFVNPRIPLTDRIFNQYLQNAISSSNIDAIKILLNSKLICNNIIRKKHIDDFLYKYKQDSQLQLEKRDISRFEKIIIADPKNNKQRNNILFNNNYMLFNFLFSLIKNEISIADYTENLSAILSTNSKFIYPAVEAVYSGLLKVRSSKQDNFPAKRIFIIILLGNTPAAFKEIKRLCLPENQKLKEEQRFKNILINKKTVAELDEDLDMSPIMYGICLGRTAAVKELIRNFPREINSRNSCNTTILMFAAQQRSVELFDFIFKTAQAQNEQVVLIDAQDNNGYTALFYAVQYGNYDIMDYLLNQKAKVDIKNLEGETPLLIAIRHHSGKKELTRILKSLLDHNANPDIQDKNENTALLTLVRKQSDAQKQKEEKEYTFNTDSIKTLIKYGASTKIGDRFNTKPLYYAVHDKLDKELINLLQ